MGKFNNGILGTVTGKVGGVVGRSWKGINTVASYQPNVANPRTNAQVAQRTKLSVLTKLASQINTGAIKPLWDRQAKKMSGFNDFIRSNMTAVNEAGTIAFEKLIISKGKMNAPEIIDVTPKPNEVDITFKTNIEDAYGLPEDKVFAVIIDKDGPEAFVASGTATRANGKITIAIPNAEHVSLRCYLAFRRADGSIVSNTGYSEG